MRLPFVASTYTGKQVRPDKLSPLQRLALDFAFPHFLPSSEPSPGQVEGLAGARARGVPATWQHRPSRRFAGDETLPAGRYYTLIRRASGDDGKALAMELLAYHDPSTCGPIALLDLGHEHDAQALNGKDRPVAHALAIVFFDAGDGTAAFLRAVGEADLRQEHEALRSRMQLPDEWASVVLIPYVLVELEIGRAIDLRYPECQEWFVAEFGTSDLDRHLHGEIADHCGWNLVDYRNVGKPAIDVMLNMSIGPPPGLPPGVSISVPSADHRELRGTFAVRGLQEWHLERLNQPDASGVLEKR